MRNLKIFWKLSKLMVSRFSREHLHPNCVQKWPFVTFAISVAKLWNKFRIVSQILMSEVGQFMHRSSILLKHYCLYRCKIHFSCSPLRSSCLWFIQRILGINLVEYWFLMCLKRLLGIHKIATARNNYQCKNLAVVLIMSKKSVWTGYQTSCSHEGKLSIYLHIRKIMFMLVYILSLYFITLKYFIMLRMFLWITIVELAWQFYMFL